jgi:ribosomal protein S18 acetylase RimI-like enzyme
MNVRAATPTDHGQIWEILEPIVRAGETYALPMDWSSEETLEYWFGPRHTVFVAEQERQLIGTYYLKPNGLGGAAHVANCGYATRSDSSGRGVGRAMAQHSLEAARERGYRAMQYNFVIASNERAVKLWESLGFQVVGRLPGVYRHPRLGFVDALTMHRVL